MNISNKTFNRVFPIPWYFASSNAWNNPFKSPMNVLITPSITKSNVIIIVISSAFINIKIISDKTNVPSEKRDFNGIALPKYFGAES